jgi:hypothetical protein
MAFKDIPKGWIEIYAAIVGSMPTTAQSAYIGTERLAVAAELADRALAAAHAHWAARDATHQPDAVDTRGVEEKAKEEHEAYLARRAVKEANMIVAGQDPDKLRQYLNSQGIDPATQDL